MRLTKWPICSQRRFRLCDRAAGRYLPPVTALSNLPELTVSELSHQLKRTVEDAFSLVKVRGEITGFKRAASGHLYLALKDDDALIDAVCWKGTAMRLQAKPQDGLEVVCTGKLTTYPGRSKYQLVIDSMELAGLGALMAMLEQRRQKLMAEGLFAAERKRPLPFLPRVIGVVTSPTGAVIRDILHRLRDRFPRHVLVWPVLVQGEGAAEQVAAAIAGFNAIAPGGRVPRPDLLIVARGGGSLEDLMAFNEEVVVRAAAASAIPLISAVGHETDTTLIDFAADRRAPTPTAAAEMAVPVRLDLAERLDALGGRLDRAALRLAGERREKVASLARGLRGPRELLMLARQRTDELTDRLPRALQALVTERQGRLARATGGLRPQVLARELTVLGERLAAQWGRADRAARQHLARHRDDLAGRARLLESLSYRGVLARGYAVVHGPDQALTSAGAATPGMAVSLEFHDGRREAVIAGSAAAAPARRPRKSGPPDDQGSLL